MKALMLTAPNDALRATMIDGTPLAAVGGWGAVSFGGALRIFRWR